jgi:hypothetical protein
MSFLKPGIVYVPYQILDTGIIYNDAFTKVKTHKEKVEKIIDKLCKKV